MARQFVAQNGDALFFHHPRSERDRLDPASGQTPDVSPREYKISCVSTDQQNYTSTLTLDHLPCPLLDRFADGRYLIADARCKWRGREDYDLNGLIIEQG
ncbi:MAG: hypothetical protein AAF513_02530 [Pseudomonadota bacterium]